MKVAVVGSNGQLGSDVVKAFAANGDVVFPLSHSDLEISSMDSVTLALGGLTPDIVINAAAMHHVDRCEKDPEKAFAVNAVGARNLATAARDLGAILMQVSTDYVFDGNRRQPYFESDPPRPLNAYGNTKLAGEYFVRAIAERHFILRTSGLYGKSPCRGKGGLNFIELMLKLGADRGTVRVVDSEVVTPTSTVQLARQMVLLSRADNFGVCHATAEGACSWFDFAREIFGVSGLKVNVERADPQEFPAKAPRPAYSVLENAALKAAGLNAFGPWQEGLSEYLGATRLSAFASTAAVQ
jgi:dTDP-4-dehydrorhamnose reductase